MRRPIYKEGYYNYHQQDSNPYNWLDTGLLLGMLTALGYVVAYSYQKGFLSYFGVDEIFISGMPIANIVFSITAVSISLFLLFGAYNNFELILKEFPVSYNPIWLMLRKSGLPLFLATIFWLGFIEYWKFYLILLSLIIFYYFVYPVICYWGIEGYKNKLEMRYKELEETGINKRNILLKWRHLPSFKVFSLVVIFLGGYYIASLLGLSQAKHKEEFLIYKTNDKEEFIVIDNIGDKFITAPVDLSKKEISKKYQMIDQKSNLKSPLIFEKVKVEGGVKVKNSNTEY
ncbi:hypothetical protein [Virgibacillus halodenitrificans]|uniref:DUF975 family protein n=1 Tax=Virgibacillus halodenitrificans TaxID=1482 RepID=A0ABR7VIZ2_VIRHA|nr:hypothetical protein [Virgibacillus halodenitrificans]MBD1221893.1 hypothetical protein [Virgibacillus halodenitrificans]